MSEFKDYKFVIDEGDIIASPVRDSDQRVLSILKAKGAPVIGQFHLEVDPKWRVKCLRIEGPKDVEGRLQFRLQYVFTFTPLEAEGVQMENHGSGNGVMKAGNGFVRPPNEKEMALDSMLARAERGQSHARETGKSFDEDERAAMRFFDRMAAEVAADQKRKHGMKIVAGRIVTAFMLLTMFLGTVELIIYLARIIVWLKGTLGDFFMATL